jgi:hypothetical protein
VTVWSSSTTTVLTHDSMSVGDAESVANVSSV